MRAARALTAEDGAGQRAELPVLDPDPSGDDAAEKRDHAHACRSLGKLSLSVLTRIVAVQQATRRRPGKFVLAVMTLGGLGLVLSGCVTPNTSSHIDAELKKHGV